MHHMKEQAQHLDTYPDLCRYLLRDAMASMLRAKWRKWDILDTAIEREGWKLLLLLRLSPMVPYNLLNIAMATTKMHFVTFTVVSAFGEDSFFLVFACCCGCHLWPRTICSTLQWQTRCTLWPAQLFQLLVRINLE